MIHKSLLKKELIITQNFSIFLKLFYGIKSQILQKYTF
jgi:hypothetical protein